LSVEEGEAQGVSTDGAVVFGQVKSRAFVWTLTAGFRYLESVLQAQKIRGYEGWKFEEVIQISEDHRSLVFNGRRPDGKRVSGILHLNVSL
jgi:hypothetical protein